MPTNKPDGFKIESWMFRAPNEYWALFISVLLLIGISSLFSLLNIYIFALVFVSILLYVKIQQNQFMGTAVRIHGNQFPDLYKIFKKYCTALEISKAQLFVKQDPTLNAFTIGVFTPTIVLTSSLVDQLTEEEIKFVIAHELGHIKAGHNLILSFTNPLGLNTIWGSLIFAFWQRKAEYTADRCGLVLTKDIDKGVTSLIKLAVGGSLFNKIDIKGYALQVKKADTKWVRLSELLVDHPFIANRVKALISFYKESFRSKIVLE
ncbi:MAG: M48 family metallopeptidase [Patescibacteria group bacterium]